MSKPYGPIRRWLDKMGLISSQPSEEQIPTAELPRPKSPAEAEPEQLTKRELEITTADTRPLPPEMAEDELTAKPKTDEEQMESKVPHTGNTASEMTERVSGPLLDLGDFESAHAAAEEDFVLDLDLDEVQEAAQASIQAAVAEPVAPTVDPMAETQEMIHPKPAQQAAPERAFTEPDIVEGEMRAPTLGRGPEGGQVSLEQLSPEAIDAIARRAVEMLSEKAVQEIAWEVVPQLAELMIKRQLEEKNS